MEVLKSPGTQVYLISSTIKLPGLDGLWISSMIIDIYVAKVILCDAYIFKYLSKQGLLKTAP